MKTHKDLDVWKRSIELVASIYKITSSFPREELYGLTLDIPVDSRPPIPVILGHLVIDFVRRYD